jgi:hypothetical protein
MAQALPRFCPRCGTPTRTNIHLCPTCGLPAEAMLSRPGNIQSGGNDITPQGPMPESARIVPDPAQIQQGGQQYRAQGQPAPDSQLPWVAQGQPQSASRFSPPQSSQNASLSSTGIPDLEDMPTQVGQPVPPVARAIWDAPLSSTGIPDLEDMPTQVEQRFSPVSPVVQEPWDSPSSSSPKPEVQAPWAEPAQPPAYVSVPQPKRRRRLGVMIVLLVVLLVLGGGGYLAYSLTGGHIPGLSPSQSPIQTTTLNLAVNYSGIDITILNVQQAQNFLDDPHTASDGMLRLNLREQNKTTAPISWNYSTSARLVEQGTPAIAPVYVRSQGNIVPGATQNSIIDFPIANGGNLNRLVFQLGTTSQAQIQIPLTSQAKLDQYQPRTNQQNGTMLYFGLNWTLTSATTSLSIPGEQAPSGMEFLVLTLKVDNTLSQEAITGSPFDYIRVEVGGKTVGPVDTSLPISFATGEMGETGTATFLVPQKSSLCTLILLSQDPGDSGQASTDFQIS